MSQLRARVPATDLRRGDVVFYVPFQGCARSEWQRGIVKRMCEDGEHAFVLYDTKSMSYSVHDLDNYTAARTRLSDLRYGSPSEGVSALLAEPGEK